MMREETYRQLSRMLLDKSQANEVRWEKANGEEDPQVFRVRLAPGAVELGLRVRERYVPDSVIIRFLGVPDDCSIEWEVSSSDDDWDLAESLYYEADRAFAGGDPFLHEFETELRSPGSVGKKGRVNP